ncbi:hypothetical protein SynBIOSE41_02975 [Synechococcus sp. BIOS-E4-1]|nr:hypothetical protein SynBIOSE41_02975 [Synechococcus sp. BIOS-E4-1]
MVRGISDVDTATMPFSSGESGECNPSAVEAAPEEKPKIGRALEMRAKDHNLRERLLSSKRVVLFHPATCGRDTKVEKHWPMS